MKLYNIVNFFGITSGEEKLGDRVFRRVSDFNRKAEMIQPVMIMRGLAEAFEEARNAKIRDIIEGYCDEQNLLNKDKEGYEKLVFGKNINMVPEPKAQEFADWYNKRIVTEITSIEPIKFLPEEIEAADKESPIDPNLLIGFSAFYDMKEMSEYAKRKKDALVETKEVLSEQAQDPGGPADNA